MIYKKLNFGEEYTPLAQASANNPGVVDVYAVQSAAVSYVNLWIEINLYDSLS